VPQAVHWTVSLQVLRIEIQIKWQGAHEHPVLPSSTRGSEGRRRGTRPKSEQEPANMRTDGDVAAAHTRARTPLLDQTARPNSITR